MKKVQRQAKEILKEAEKQGVEQNFLFITTFKRYLRQLDTLDKLEAKIEEDGTLVTKEYVKGRGNVYIHPAVSEYNRTTDSANKTVSTLIRIIKGFGEGKNDDGEDDVLMKVLSGGID